MGMCKSLSYTANRIFMCMQSKAVYCDNVLQNLRKFILFLWKTWAQRQLAKKKKKKKTMMVKNNDNSLKKIVKIIIVKQKIKQESS